MKNSSRVQHRASHSSTHPRAAFRAFTLIEMLVGIAIALIVFLGFFQTYKVAADANVSAKERAGAVGVLESEMEYVRSLPYASVGISGGSPSGTIQGTQTLTPNGIPYAVTITVGYVDDPADGTGAGDTNANTHDYKAVRMIIQWTFRGQSQSLTSVTYIAPVGIET